MIGLKKEKTKDIIAVLSVILTGALFLSYFKLKHSMNFINLDELLWMYRSRFFMDSLLSFDFSHLIQSAQPGIMVMWASGPFMKIIDYDFVSVYNFVNNLDKSGIPYNIINSRDGDLFLEYREASFLFNIPVLAIMASFFFAAYFLLRKLDFSRWSVSFALLLIATTPYYVYFTTPTDKFVGIFATLSLLNLLVYLEEKGGRKYLAFSALLGAWAALTKLSALFLVPLALLIVVFYRNKSSVLEQFDRAKGAITALKWRKLSLNRKMFTTFDLRLLAKDYALWLAVFFVSCSVFLPTIITDPFKVVNFFLKQDQRTSIIGEYDVFLNLKIIAAYLFDSSLQSFNLFVLIAYISFVFLIIQQIKNKINTNKKEIVIAAYPLVFFLFVTLFSRTYSFRYLVPVLIVLQIAAGEGIYQFANILSRKWKLKDKEAYFWAVALILISQALLIYYSEVEKIENLPNFQ